MPSTLQPYRSGGISDYQAATTFYKLDSLNSLTHHTLTMAPSLEEPTQVDLDAPLKTAPKLVAPEPGTFLPQPP